MLPGRPDIVFGAGTLDARARSASDGTNFGLGGGGFLAAGAWFSSFGIGGGGFLPAVGGPAFSCSGFGIGGGGFLPAVGGLAFSCSARSAGGGGGGT